MLPDSAYTHALSTHFQVLHRVVSAGLFVGKLSAGPQKEVQGLSVHNGEMDKDISQTVTLDLFAEYFPEAPVLHFMLVH